MNAVGCQDTLSAIVLVVGEVRGEEFFPQICHRTIVFGCHVADNLAVFVQIAVEFVRHIRFFTNARGRCNDDARACGL